MGLNRECKREIVAAIVFNVAYVVLLLLANVLNFFDLVGIKPELQVALWMIAGFSIVASVISIFFSYYFYYKRRRR